MLICAQVTDSLNPSTLEIKNNSHLHAHHKAMRDSTSRETHFEYDRPAIQLCFQPRHADLDCRVHITSDAFRSKPQLARHRMIYTLLKDELAAEGGIHNLSLKTRTVEEEERVKKGGEAAAA